MFPYYFGVVLAAVAIVGLLVAGVYLKRARTRKLNAWTRADQLAYAAIAISLASFAMTISIFAMQIYLDSQIS